jgi:hypothetical protein
MKSEKSVLEFFDNEENKIIIDRLKITVYRFENINPMLLTN